MATKLKAYLGADEDGGEIVFATSLANAEKMTDHGPVRRASEYDEWAVAGRVPTQILIEQFDWHFDCRYHACNVSCNNTGEMWDGEDLLEESEPVYDGNDVYCCAEHKQMQADWVAERKAIKESLPAKLAHQFPGTTLVKSWVYSDPPTVEFKFLGGLGTVSWEVGTSKIWVERRDIPAWETYAASAALPAAPATPEKEAAA